MADQHEPEPGSNLPDKSRPADVVDAEVVDSDLVAAPAPAEPARPVDEEAEFREFEEFQRFKRYREQQRAQGGDLAVPPPTAAPPAEQPKKPWWKTALGLLRYKFVRRLIYLLVLLLLLDYAYDYYFGSSNSGSDTSSSGQPPVRPQPRKAPTPEYALFDIYNLLRGDDPALACGLFDATGENGFAVAHQASDCATAAQRVHDQITDRNAYANPKIGYDAIATTGREAVVHGCRIQVTGGPQLGSLKLTQQQDGGWAISAYALQSTTCP